MTERFGKARELAAAAYVSDTLFSLVSVPLMVLFVTELWKFVA
jgi:predicted permease